MTAWLVPLQETAGQWSEHKDARLGAALAYYSIFSLGPLIVIAVAIAGLAFGTEAVQAQVFGALHGLLGDSGTQAIEAMLKGANRPREGVVPTVIGVGTLVFAAVGVVVQLKDALNT
jgi:membrane protein